MYMYESVCGMIALDYLCSLLFSQVCIQTLTLRQTAGKCMNKQKHVQIQTNICMRLYAHKIADKV